MTEPDFITITRAGYDAVAVDYAEEFSGETARAALDRAVLASFAELVGDTARVVDVGCGPGRVTAYLAGLGLSASGIDLSPGMIAQARLRHPGLRFDVGSMTALDLPDGAVDGLLAWYSTIHIPDGHLPGVLGEFQRVLAPGGLALFAFQVGDEPLHLNEALGHTVSLVFHRRTPDGMAALMGTAGFVEHARVVREREDVERTPQAFMLFRKPRESNGAAAAAV